MSKYIALGFQVLLISSFQNLKVGIIHSLLSNLALTIPVASSTFTNKHNSSPQFLSSSHLW
ncbi:MAG: hypothetical protein LBU14_05405 [Candidatus Peribacteria bacterium]|nr:hypothetical protein [Candidatus Peribacteria bacterium]